MNKKQSNLLITTISLIIVLLTIIKLYDIYLFHTYQTVVSYDYFLTLKDKDFSLENYELYKDQNNYHCGDGNLVLGSLDIVDGTDIELSFKFNQKDYLTYSLKYLNGGSYYLESKDDLKELDKIDKVEMIIKTDKIIYQKQLKLEKAKKLNCVSKAFKIENACVSNNYMRLGYLTSSDKELLKKYPNISLEYRYLKKANLDEDNDNNYHVFKKVSGKTKELVNKNIYQTYTSDLNENLKDRKLSVVVIMSNDKDNYVFKMNYVDENGDLYE